MNNSDNPAMPYDHTFEDVNGDILRLMHTGLTKREHFAGLAMQGFISAGHSGMPNASELSDYAVRYADALLRELAA